MDHTNKDKDAKESRQIPVVPISQINGLFTSFQSDPVIDENHIIDRHVSGGRLAGTHGLFNDKFLSATAKNITLGYRHYVHKERMTRNGIKIECLLVDFPFYIGSKPGWSLAPGDKPYPTNRLEIRVILQDNTIETAFPV